MSDVWHVPDGREPSRTIELHLTGHMERFAWHFNGVKCSDAEPIRLKYGERVRITLVNDTMMSHPIHLHGMWSDLEDDEEPGTVSSRKAAGGVTWGRTFFGTADLARTEGGKASGTRLALGARVWF